MKKSTIIIFGLLSFMISCKNAEKNNTNNADGATLSCSSVSRASAILKDNNLDPVILKSIDSIQVDKQLVDNFDNMRRITGGVFEMGGDMPSGFEDMPKTALPQGDELPKHAVQINDFWIDTHEVTNAQFKAFIDATGYITIAERPLDWEEIKKQVPPGTPKPPEENLLPGSLVFHYADKNATKDYLDNWWSFVKGANWQHPKGPGSSIEGLDNYPVVHVSWYDAIAYAKWSGKRLPTEAEYEYAMRGGKKNLMYPWGNEKTNSGKFYSNHLQGEFPYSNTKADGFEYLAPIKSFPANGYGLYDIAGNVWEWTNDWYSAKYYYDLEQSGNVALNPQGPEEGFEVQNNFIKKKSIKGGSFLCHDDWCSGYRNARRMRNTPDTSMEHVGFRCVRDAIK